MNYHIVRTNDAIEKIASIYNLTINEIKNINTHISNWKNLVPGTRLKLPPIPESISEELNDTEPFIEDYYPKIDIKKYESNLDINTSTDANANANANAYTNTNVNTNTDKNTSEFNNINSGELIEKYSDKIYENYSNFESIKDMDVKKEEVINENILKEHKNVKYVNSIKLPPSYSYYYNPYDYYQYMRKNRRIRRH